MELEKHLINIEKKLWTNDAALYKNNLVGEALLVFGETGVITRDTAVAAILAENKENRRWADVEFTEVRSLQFTKDVGLLTYKVVARWEHENSRYLALASSIYVNHEDVWKLAFHQQTPIQGE